MTCAGGRTQPMPARQSSGLGLESGIPTSNMVKFIMLRCRSFGKDSKSIAQSGKSVSWSNSKNGFAIFPKITAVRYTQNLKLKLQNYLRFLDASSIRTERTEPFLLLALRKNVTKAMQIWALMTSKPCTCWPWRQKIINLAR